MSSSAFQQFLAQLQAKDYAKAQGFDLGWYDHMSPQELQQAEHLLLAQARTGDMSPLPSLAKLATPAAVAFLEQTLQEKKYYPESGLDYDLAKYLWDITHDERYLETFEKFSLKNKTAKTRFIKYLADLPDSAKRINQLLEFIKDDYQDSAVRATIEILKLLGLIKPDESNSEQYRGLFNMIRGERQDERNKGQKELMALIERFHKNIM
ncbi:hypothetical protein [Hymenobacter cellulosivorans]|uniref:HEAT repeat domain-containing protein n=1 Tax=Hymenobacter cellulosivorans TaxID=2932249 RepID=A0ABY4FHE1_9BACT|nr:hypothetical protein [Hymenobacter cellulosivorans]UOQ55546.1 hypothetical protein MUN80_12480 [Hymenobacter cellulosivorans]